MSQLIKLSPHSWLYRGFTIRICPRNSSTGRASYLITNDGESFGRDFALSEAIKSIDVIRGGIHA